MAVSRLLNPLLHAIAQSHDGLCNLYGFVYPLGTPLLYYVLLRRHKTELNTLMANQMLRIKRR